MSHTGRTLPTYTNIVDEYTSFLRKYRSALRKEDQEAFDQLMAFARLHVSAGNYTARLNPLESMFISIMLEQQRELGRIQRLLGVKATVVQDALVEVDRP